MCKLVKNPVVTLLLAAVLVVGCTATLKGSIALVVSLLITLVLSAVVLSGLNKLLTKDIRLLAIIIVMVTTFISFFDLYMFILYRLNTLG